jgi:peptide-methionine (S)-S-oxide reductase
MKERMRVLTLLLLGAAALGVAPPAAGRPEPAATATATFAGGCFWSMERIFEQLPGVTSATVGFTGGTVANPSYTQVTGGRTGHLEAVQVVYDPAQVSYETLLDTYWHNIDPLQDDGQFCDRGAQYHTAIFYADSVQRRLAQESRQQVATLLKGDVATQIRPAVAFYPAEEYHQSFYKKNPERYEAYRHGCGQDRWLKEVWGKHVTSTKAGK